MSPRSPGTRTRSTGAVLASTRPLRSSGRPSSNGRGSRERTAYGSKTICDCGGATCDRGRPARDPAGATRSPGDLVMTPSALLRSMLAILLLVGLALGPGSLEPAQAADQVTLALDWIVNGTHAGYFVALDKGFYAANNLDSAD